MAAKEIPNLNARVTLVRGIGEKVLDKVRGIVIAHASVK